MLKALGILIMTIGLSAANRGAPATPLNPAITPPTTIFVDCAASSRGNGTARHPWWRITDALDQARSLRRADPRRIVILVAAGECSGNFEPQPIAVQTRPPELLPLVLNIPNLTLHGAGIMEYVDGYPVAQRPGTATTVTVDTPRFGALDNVVMLIGPTADGARADGTVVEGMRIDVAFNSWLGLYVTRTQRLAVRDNVVEHVGFGDMSVTDSSGSITGNVLHDGTPGLFVGAGSQVSPARLYVGGNTITGTHSGLTILGNSMATEQLDMGANPLAMLPYRIDPTDREQGNRIEAEIAGNDVSYNYAGLRFSMLGIFHYPYSQVGTIKANVHDNRFLDNSGFPFSIEAGYLFRGTSSYWTNPDPFDFPDGFFGFLAAPFVIHGPFDGPYSAVANVHLEHNLWSNADIAPVAPAQLTFTYTDAADPTLGAPDPALFIHYPYLRNSRMNIEDDDGLFSLPGAIRDDLRLYDPLDGTALLNQTRIRH